MATWYTRLMALQEETGTRTLEEDVKSRLDSGANVRELWKTMQHVLGEDRNAAAVAKKGWDWQRQAVDHELLIDRTPTFAPVHAVDSTIAGHSFDIHHKEMMMQDSFEDAIHSFTPQESTTSTMTWDSSTPRMEEYQMDPVHAAASASRKRKQQSPLEKSVSLFGEPYDTNRAFDPQTGKHYRMH